MGPYWLRPFISSFFWKSTKQGMKIENEEESRFKWCLSARLVTDHKTHNLWFLNDESATKDAMNNTMTWSASMMTSMSSLPVTPLKMKPDSKCLLNQLLNQLLIEFRSETQHSILSLFTAALHQTVHKTNIHTDNFILQLSNRAHVCWIMEGKLYKSRINILPWHLHQ